MEKHKKEKKKLGLSTKIFIALLTGAVCGVPVSYTHLTLPTNSLV